MVVWGGMGGAWGMERVWRRWANSVMADNRQSCFCLLVGGDPLGDFKLS